MPHTLELSMKLTDLPECNDIVTRLYNYARKNNKNCCYHFKQNLDKMTVSGTEFTGFTDKGITMHVSKYSNPLFTNYTWEIKINPKSRNGIDRISVADETDVQEAFKLLDDLLAAALNMPYTYKDFRLKRIDCCYNYDFISSSFAKIYMSLLKKGDISDCFSFYDEYIKTSHRKKSPKDSIYCSNKSVTINIYLKTKQLENDRYIDGNFDLSTSAGIIRFEVECKRSKLISSLKRLQVEGLYPEPFIKDNFNFYILQYYLTKFFRIGDYYSYAYAKRTIENSNYHNRSKHLMCTLLELTSRRNGLKNAKNEMIAMGYSRYDIKITLSRFDELRVNPVTIPVKDIKDENMYLLSPTNLLLNYK